MAVQFEQVKTGGVYVTWTIEDRKTGEYVATYDASDDSITYTTSAREALVTHDHVHAGRIGHKARMRDGKGGMRIALVAC